MEARVCDMTTPDQTLDLVAELRTTPRPERRRRVDQLAYPTLLQLTLVLLDEPVATPAAATRSQSEP